MEMGLNYENKKTIIIASIFKPCNFCLENHEKWLKIQSWNTKPRGPNQCD